MPALTIVHHPDSARVGQVARFDPSAKVTLSRLAPEFTPPGGFTHAPLGDPCLSRRGGEIRFEGARAFLDPGALELAVDGARVDAPRAFEDEDLERGVVLELSERVVLLLHRVGPPRERGPRFGLVGDSDAVEELRADVVRVADLPVPVLLRGESGVGKELVARALHAASSRANRPCVCVNMATLAPALAPSELFGHQKGAFTGAVRDHKGYFEQADGGTLFLDEIADTPAEVQPMLLRALEHGEIQPLGGGAARRVDVRLVAATDADLEGAVDDDRFRRPLLHRLAGYELVVPPLRARRDDVGRLLIHFLRVELELIGEPARLAPTPPDKRTWLPAELVSRLVRHPWPGNIRQLRNVVRQLVISSRGLPELRVDASLARTLGGLDPSTSSPATPLPPEPVDSEPQRRGVPATAEDLAAALSRNGWRIGETAAQLGISKARLYQLMEQHPGFRKAKDLSADDILHRRDECAGDLSLMAERLQVSERGLKLRMRELKLT